MFGERDHGRTVQRGIDEALGCRDMLEAAPVQQSRLTRVYARISAMLRAMVPAPRLTLDDRRPALPKILDTIR